MATCFGGVGNTPIENYNTQEVDNTSEDESQNDNLVRWLLCKTARPQTDGIRSKH